jgi:hypothetical protein
MPAFDSKAHDNESQHDNGPRHNDETDGAKNDSDFGNPLAKEALSPGVSQIEL